MIESVCMMDLTKFRIFKLKAKHSLSDDQFMIRKRYLGSEESFGITTNRAGSINLKTGHFELKALDEPLKKSVIIHFIRF